jgi:hypothetical protein
MSKKSEIINENTTEPYQQTGCLSGSTIHTSIHVLKATSQINAIAILTLDGKDANSDNLIKPNNGEVWNIMIQVVGRDVVNHVNNFMYTEHGLLYNDNGTIVYKSGNHRAISGGNLSSKVIISTVKDGLAISVKDSKVSVKWAATVIATQV